MIVSACSATPVAVDQAGAVRADQRRDVAFDDAWHVRHVDEELVHADAADHGAALATDEERPAVAEMPAPAVGVPYRDERDG